MIQSLACPANFSYYTNVLSRDLANNFVAFRRSAIKPMKGTYKPDRPGAEAAIVASRYPPLRRVTPPVGSITRVFSSGGVSSAVGQQAGPPELMGLSSTTSHKQRAPTELKTGDSDEGPCAPGWMDYDFVSIDAGTYIIVALDNQTDLAVQARDGVKMQ